MISRHCERSAAIHLLKCILIYGLPRHFVPRNDVAILNIFKFFLADCMNAVCFKNFFCLLHVGAADNHTGAVGLATGKAVHVFDVAAV